VMNLSSSTSGIFTPRDPKDSDFASLNESPPRSRRGEMEEVGNIEHLCSLKFTFTSGNKKAPRDRSREALVVQFGLVT